MNAIKMAVHQYVEKEQASAARCCDTCSERFSDYGEHHVAVAFEAGYRTGLEKAAEIADDEKREYEFSMRNFDKRGDVHMGTNEARCAVTAQFLAEAIRAFAATGRADGR